LRVLTVHRVVGMDVDYGHKLPDSELRGVGCINSSVVCNSARHQSSPARSNT
jgi:hypothetical protein